MNLSHKKITGELVLKQYGKIENFTKRKQYKLHFQLWNAVLLSKSLHHSMHFFPLKLVNSVAIHVMESI